MAQGSIRSNRDQSVGWVETNPASANARGRHPRGGRTTGQGSSFLDIYCDPGHWIIPAGDQEGYSAAEHLQWWLAKGFLGFGPGTAGRKSIQVGDLVCFYVAGVHQVVAYGRIAGELSTLVQPHEWPGPTVPSDDVQGPSREHRLADASGRDRCGPPCAPRCVRDQVADRRLVVAGSRRPIGCRPATFFA